MCLKNEVSVVGWLVWCLLLALESIWKIIAMWHNFFSLYGCSRKLLMSAVKCLLRVVVTTRQMMRSSISSLSGEDCIMPVTSFSVYICGLMYTTVYFAGWIMMSSGFNKGSCILEYVLSAFLSCMEKKGKLNTGWRMSKMVLLLCRKSNPVNGLVGLVMTMKLSLNKISLTPNCISTVALGVSKCPFATIIWKSVGGPSLKIVCSASNRIFCKSASQMALVNCSVLMRPSIVDSPKSIGKKSILFLFFNWRFVDKSWNSVFLLGIDWRRGVNDRILTFC